MTATGKQRLPQVLGDPRCFACGLPVRWLRVDGAREPTACERAPSKLNGTLEPLGQDRAQTLGRYDAARAREAGQDLYVPHFCPGNRRPRKRSIEPFQLRLKPETNPQPGGTDVPTG